MKHNIEYGEYKNKVFAAWMGKSIGGTIGARMENHKTIMNLAKEDLWPEKIMPNDDMDIQIVWLEALQERGIWLESDDLADFWQDRCWYNFCEYGVFLNNYQRGIHPPLSGTWNNKFFYESEGCPIRSEIWGLICPGNPSLAANYARKDAQLDHGGASVLCEMFLAAADAAAFFSDDIDQILDIGLSVLPPDSVVHRMVWETRAICASHPVFKDAWRLIVRRFGDRDASKAIMNQAIVVMALILGRGDFAETMRLAVNSGWDTDCTAATAGALLGIMHGIKTFPKEWLEKMGNNLACGIEVKHRTASFSTLTEDTVKLGIEITHLRSDSVEILNATEVSLRPAVNEQIKLNVTYPGEPVLRPGKKTPIILHFHNHSSSVQTGKWELKIPNNLKCDCSRGKMTLASDETRELELIVSTPASEILWDKNLFTLVWNDDNDNLIEYIFGLGGARIWRMYGPYFDMWDTLKNERCPYNNNGAFSFPQNGDSWNHYVRLDKEYLNEKLLLKEDILEELPEKIQLGEDYIEGAQLVGFNGPACFYIVRELVAKESCRIAFHITANVPLAVWFDGKEIIRREYGREVSLQDGFIEPVKIDNIPKRLVIKLARQSDFLSLCVAATKIPEGKPERKRGISIFADSLGDIPFDYDIFAGIIFPGFPEI